MDIHLEPKQLRIDLTILRRILRIGLPAGIQSAVFAISNIVIQSAINSLGTVVMAASSAAFNIEIITYAILNAFSQACTTFVGQNFCAGELGRCKRTLALCLTEGIITLAAAIAVILFFGKQLLTILGVCGIRIAWIQFVFPQSRTFQTIMAAYPISLSVTALLIFAALLYYRRPGGLPCRKKANVPPTPGLRKGPCFALCTP